jgi:hypothetical protein
MTQSDIITLVHSLYNLKALNEHSLKSLYLTVSSFSQYNLEHFIEIFTYLDEQIESPKKYMFYSQTLFQAIQNLNKYQSNYTQTTITHFCRLVKQHWHHIHSDDKNKILNQIYKHSFEFQKCIENLLQEQCFFIDFCLNPVIYYQSVHVLLKKWDSPAQKPVTSIHNIALNNAQHLDCFSSDKDQVTQLFDDDYHYFNFLSHRYPEIILNEKNSIFFTQIESSVIAFYMIKHLMAWGWKKWSYVFDSSSRDIFFNHFINIVFFVSQKFPKHFHLIFSDINLVKLLFKDYYRDYHQEQINLNELFTYYAIASADDFISDILRLDETEFYHHKLMLLLDYLLDYFSKKSFLPPVSDGDFISLIKLHEIITYIQGKKSYHSKELNYQVCRKLRKQYHLNDNKTIQRIFLNYELNESSWLLSDGTDMIEDNETVVKI